MAGLFESWPNFLLSALTGRKAGPGPGNTARQGHMCEVAATWGKGVYVAHRCNTEARANLS